MYSPISFHHMQLKYVQSTNFQGNLHVNKNSAPAESMFIVIIATQFSNRNYAFRLSFHSVKTLAFRVHYTSMYLLDVH